MNYFVRIKKGLLLVLISLFIQSCKNTCIKSNDFGEQSNVDLFKISARDLSDCVFSETDSSSSYDNMPKNGILGKCMIGYKYNEDTNEYSEKQTETAYSLIKSGYFDLGNASNVFSAFESKLEQSENKDLYETFKKYYCKDFDYLTDQDSNFEKDFKDNETIIKKVDIVDLNMQIYKECGNYCSNVCSGSLSNNNSSFDAATFSQLSWPHSTLKSSGSYYGINFKDTSNFKITATGSIQTSGMSTNIDGSDSSIIIKNNPYLPSYNLDSNSVWIATDKADLFAKIEVPEALSKDDEFLSKFYLDFINFSDKKLQSKSIPVECDNVNVNMPNYVQKKDGKNEYNGSMVFSEPKYSSVYCNYSKMENICEFEADYAKLLTETGCLTKVESLNNADLFNNTVGVELFNDLQKNYYKYAVNDLEDIIEDKYKKFVLSKSEEKTAEFKITEDNKTTLRYYEYSYSDGDGENILQYTIDEDNLKYTGQRTFEFGRQLNMPFKVYIKSDKEDLSDSNKCIFKVNAKNNIENFIKSKVGLTDVDVSDISYGDKDGNITISSDDTWYPITQGGVPVVLNEYYSDAMANSDFYVKITTNGAGCFDKLTIKIVPLREIQIKQTGFLFFKNVLKDNSNNEIKFQVINPDLKTIVESIEKDKSDLYQPNIDDYKKEIRANYFEYYQYNKTRDNADMINDTFTTVTSISVNDLKNIELLGKTLKENITNYSTIFKKNAIFVRKGQVIRFDDSNWLNTNDLSIKTKAYDGVNIAGNIDLIYFIKERPALMCLTDKFSRDINISKVCPNSVLPGKKLYTFENNTATEKTVYLCNLDIKKETIDESNNSDCYVNITDTSGNFANLKYFVKNEDDEIETRLIDFKNETDTNIKYINIAEAFNTTLQNLYSITDFIEQLIGINDNLRTVAAYRGAISELRSKFKTCLNSEIFLVKNKMEIEKREVSQDETENRINILKDAGFMEIDKDSLEKYLEEIEKVLSGSELGLFKLEEVIKSGKVITKANYESLNGDNTIFYTADFKEGTNSKMDCEAIYPDKDGEDKEKYNNCVENNKEINENDDKLILSFNLTLFDSLKDDGCSDLTTGLCTRKLMTCLDFSNYFGSVYNFNDIIKTDNKKFSYDTKFANNAENIITGFNISGTVKNGGDLTTFKTSNNYDESNDAENVITCSNGNSSSNCYNQYKMTNVIVSSKIFPRLLDLNRDFLFPKDSVVTNGEKTLSFKITSQDKKSNGENLAVFVGSADNLYDINDDGKLCVINGGKDCQEENENNIYWLVGYDSLKAQNGKLNLRENNPFKFDINGQLVKANDNKSIISVNDIMTNDMKVGNSAKNGYNLAFFFKILDEDTSDKNNNGFYTIKITELSSGAMNDVMQNWFQRRQALSDSSINFKLEEPISVVNLLFNSILGIMDGESYGVRSDEKKCDKTLSRLKEEEQICFIHGYSKNDTLSGRSCGTDGIEGYGSESSGIAEEYCLQSCDQISSNEVNVRCNVVYNNGGLLKLLYVNIIQNTLYQFIVKLALVLMLTLYGFGYFLGLSEFNQKEIMTRILRACFIYALISNTGWALYDKFVVSFFKQGIDSLLFLIASSFEVGENNYIEQAVLQNDYSVKLLLFSSTFENIKMLFSEAVLYKILGLIFSGWLGILYAYLVLTGLITYIVGMFNAIALYLMAQMFMSITLSIGPMIFLLMFFERTKGSFDNWLSILIGFALQEIFIIITISFFNNLISSIIKTVFAYPVCILPIVDINLLGIPLSILQFWKIPGTGFSGNILDLQNQAGPSFYSILLFYIVANLSNKFVIEMADLGNDIGDGIKATDIASTMTNAISTTGNKVNAIIGDVASAPFKRSSDSVNNWAQRIGNEAKQSMKNRFDNLNEARISPIKDSLEKQLSQGKGEEKLQKLYQDAHSGNATGEQKKEYKEALNNAANEERLEKLIKNENLDKATRDYFKKKGIDIDEKDDSGNDKFTAEQKREFKEYFLGEKGYINKKSMKEGRREATDNLVRATKKVDNISQAGWAEETSRIRKQFGRDKVYDDYAKALATFRGDTPESKADEEGIARPASANISSNGMIGNANVASDKQNQNSVEHHKQQMQNFVDNGKTTGQTISRVIPQDMDEVNEDVMKFREDTRSASED